MFLGMCFLKFFLLKEEHLKKTVKYKEIFCLFVYLNIGSFSYICCLETAHKNNKVTERRL